jgi:hypothetical protein
MTGSVVPSTGATIVGTITLPGDATGKKYYVIVGPNLTGGSVSATTGTVTGSSIPYSLPNVPAGTYYLYSNVDMTGHWGSASGGNTASGDYICVYGATSIFTYPSAPNFSVPSTGTVTGNWSAFVAP